MTEQAPPLVRVRGLEKRFGDYRALAGIDLDIARGERLVVCGPSGSGKSTLAYCLNGLEPHDAGRILFDGMPLDEELGTAHQLRRSIGMVFQSFNLFPHLSVLENCTLAPRLVLRLSEQEAHRRAMENLERVGIADQATKRPDRLSGGQQQRVAIARALCMRPRLMLFDEPTSALDPEMVKEVLDVMIELAQSGMTMVCITHEMGFARAAADRIVFMDEGRIIHQAPPETFFGDQQEPRIRRFLADITTG
ncbi:amino acid ABC transporter ATP-binding protein [Geminicoccaceae bacterium 1502E]|nr:amino acid ABC transporter ATP-binding protein [Geminicoccaceae bacterium 1502E]